MKLYYIALFALVTNVAYAGKEVSRIKRHTPPPPKPMADGEVLQGKVSYVVPIGPNSISKKGRGTSSSPFVGLKEAVEHLTAGDTLILKPGVYRDTIDLRGKTGPITIRSEKRFEAVLKGTQPISSLSKGDWKKVGKVYSIELSQPIHQLFSHEVNMTLARWPNAQEFSKKMWNMPETWRHQHAESSFGVMVDERPGGSKKGKVNGDEGNIDHFIPDGVNVESLADTGIDFTGAYAVMNIGSWLSWAQEVTKHEAGSDRFTYSTDFSRSGKIMKKAADDFLRNEEFFNRKKVQGHYYLVGRAALDQAMEWWFDKEESRLYLIPPEGTHPHKMNLEGKVKAFSIEAEAIVGLRVENIKFFGTTFNIINCVQALIDGNHFLYPSYNRLTLGDFKPPEMGEVSTMETSSEVVSQNRISNNTFEKMDGPVLWMAGRHDVIENNIMSEIDFTSLGYGGGGTLTAIDAEDLLFTRNTLHTAGCSEGFRLGNRNEVSYNHVYNTGLLQHDGSAINAGIKSQKGSYIHHNWVHDTAKQGIRLDAVSKTQHHVKTGTLWYGKGTELSHNVAWNVQMNQNKGDDHKIYHSVYFNGRKSHFGVIRSDRMGGINKNTEVFNILCPRIDSVWWGKVSERPPVPGHLSHNVLADPNELLRGPEYYDFRPKRDSKLIDAGKKVAHRKVSYVGENPDVGAYEHGDRTYWIPGAQGDVARTPVPKDGAVQVHLDASLMWLPSRDAKEQWVYFASTRKACLGAVKPNVVLSGKENVVDLNLASGQIVFWRVVSICENGSTETSPIWSFATASK